MNLDTIAEIRAIYARAGAQLAELDTQLIYGHIDNEQYTAETAAVEHAAKVAIEAAREPQVEQQ